MATLVKYVCDSCGEFQVTEEQLGQFWEVSILIQNKVARHRSAWATPSKKQTAEWCRKCVDKNGLLAPMILKPDEKPKEVTIEEIIRNIVQQETHGTPDDGD